LPEFPTAANRAPVAMCSLNFDASLLQMHKQYVHVCAVTAKDDLVTGRSCTVDFRNRRIVMQRRFNMLDMPAARRVYRRPVAKLAYSPKLRG
jgi:hypothetical protein